jgi:hypothetical protein
MLGQSARRKLDVNIHTSFLEIIVRNATVGCRREPRRVSCLLVDFTKKSKIFFKQSNNNSSNIFLISFQYKENLETINSNFGKQYVRHLKKVAN